MEPACGMWCIQGTITKQIEPPSPSAPNGVTISPQFATFYLHPEVQGCTTKEAAERVAAGILNPFNDPKITPNPYAVHVSVAAVATWSDEERARMQDFNRILNMTDAELAS